MTDLFGDINAPLQVAGTARQQAYFDRLVDEFYRAAVYLMERVKRDGWHFNSNYLREHVRCATHLQFSNTLSPKILRALRERHPELKPYIDISALKDT